MDAKAWFHAFLEALDHHEASVPLRQAALEGRLRAWTIALTKVVASTCGKVGWRAVAKGHECDFLPEGRNEYLGLDVTAFDGRQVPWPFPVAVFELENSAADDRVAYSLWKVLCVRAQQRYVFAYRRTPDDGRALLSNLEKDVVSRIEVRERADLRGETVVVMGLKDEAATFPHGFFRPWRLDPSLAKFERLA